MPQDTDTVLTATDNGYSITPVNTDSLDIAVQKLKTVLVKEQEFQKRSDAYSQWAPLYTLILLTALWFIIKWKNRSKRSDIQSRSDSRGEDEITIY